MSINDIITSAFPHFLADCRTNNVISESRTSFDILQDVMLQSIRHFKNKKVCWDDGFKYIKDTFYLELYFSPKRKGKEEYVPDITDYERFMKDEEEE